MDNTRKKQLKRILLWIGMAALVAYLAVMPLMAQEEAEAEGPVASILQATAETASIETALRGGGTLTAGNAMDVKLPAGVKITEFLVKNGQIITEGTPVAAVDPVSLMNAIVEVQDTLDYLRQEIRDASDDSVDSTVTAKAGGLVKKVYAQAGDSVQDVMIRHGALAVLSLDGRMAVKISRVTSLAAGDTVCVTVDGQEITGRVESSLDGQLIVSMEDDGYEIGRSVTVTTEDGERIGSGELYVHNAWNATGYSGTVRTVYAKENREVSSGSTLFTLTDTDFTGTRDSMASLHREYEQLLQDMFRMYETGTVDAPCDGLVSGIDSNSASLLAGDGSESWTVLLLSGGAVCDGTDHDGTVCTAEDHIKGCYYYCTGKANCTAKPEDHRVTCLALCIASDGSTPCTALNHKPNCIESCICSSETGKCPATGVHKTGCIESCVSTDGAAPCPATGTHKTDCLYRCDKTADCTATKHHYPTCLTFCTGAEDCPAENHKDDCYMASLVYYAYAARVDQVGATELIVYEDQTTLYQVRPGSNGWVLVNPTALKTDLMITQATRAVSDPTKFSAGDIVLFWTGYKDDTPVKYGEALYKAAPDAPSDPGTGDKPGQNPGGFPSGWPGGVSGFGGLGGAGQADSFQLFDLDGQTLMTVTEQEVMTLTIAIDEQDIAKVSLGQTAQIQVTALKGQTFLAEVTDIGGYGISNGGSSKFSVELTMPLAENMLAGMNATAAIPLSTKQDVLTVPVAALVETAAGTVVYTALDPETGEPASPVPVTVGVSDGEKAEILSGLRLGDTIYYSYYDTLELDHTAKADNPFSFG